MVKEEGAVQDVLDRLDREECCISVTTLSMEQGISRARASQWLEEAVRLRTPTIATVTNCQMTSSVLDDAIPCTSK